MGHTTIIAEAGVNHNGSLPLALQLVDAAAEAGADVVKFQTFRASKLTTRTSVKAAYQTQTTDASESQYEMLERLELDHDSHLAILERCKEREIQFLSTPFDEESLDWLVTDIGLSTVKFSSGDITNGPLLYRAARAGKPVILSTGMSTLSDVESALSVLAFGYLQLEDTPSQQSFRNAFCSGAGQHALKENVTLLHCTTEYPSPFADVNLKVIRTLEQAFGLPVGLSDHTQGISVPIAAVALGATVIEKHFTLDKNMPGPDHKASLDPKELKEMVKSIREVELALGVGIKVPAPSELKNQVPARKSLVAATSIQKGEPFSPKNLTVKRPGNGLTPMLFWELMGQPATRNYAADDVIER